MRTTKDMMLQSQKNAIRLATDSLHFGEEIRNKNLYGQEVQNQSARMVLKRENPDTISILLETLIQLLENLRFHQSGANISIQQKVWQQEIVRQIKNQINIYQQYHVQGNLQQTFRQLQNEQAFENTEVLEQTIANIRQELKKNADAIIQERTPIFNRIGHTLFSVSVQNMTQDYQKIDFHTNQTQSKHRWENRSVWENQLQNSNIFSQKIIWHHNQNTWFATNQEHPFRSIYYGYHMTAKNMVQRNITIGDIQNIEKKIQFDIKNALALSYVSERKQEIAFDVTHQTNVRNHTMLHQSWRQKWKQPLSNYLSAFSLTSIDTKMMNRIQQNSLFFQKKWFFNNQNFVKIDLPQYTQMLQFWYHTAVIKQIQHQKQKLDAAFEITYPLQMVQTQNIVLQEIQKKTFHKDNLFFYHRQQYEYDAESGNGKQQTQQNLIQNQWIQQRIIQNIFDTMSQNRMISKIESNLSQVARNWLFANYGNQNVLQKQSLSWIQSANQKIDIQTKQQQFFSANQNKYFDVSSLQQENRQKLSLFFYSKWLQSFMNVLQTQQLSSIRKNVDGMQINIQKNRLLPFSVLSEQKQKEVIALHLLQQKQSIQTFVSKENKLQHHLQKIYPKRYNDVHTIYQSNEIDKENVSYDTYHIVLQQPNLMSEILQILQKNNIKNTLFWKKMQHSMMHQKKITEKRMALFLQMFPKQFHMIQNQQNFLYDLQIADKYMAFWSTKQYFYRNQFGFYDTKYHNMLHLQEIKRNFVPMYQNLMQNMAFTKMQHFVRNQNDLEYKIQSFSQYDTAFAITRLQHHHLGANKTIQAIQKYNPYLWYQTTPSFCSEIVYHQKHQVFLHTNQNLYQSFSTNVQPEIINQQQIVLKHDISSQQNKVENIDTHLDSYTKIYHAHHAKQWYDDQSSYFVKHILQKNAMQKYIVESPKWKDAFGHSTDNESKEQQKSWLYNDTTIHIGKMIWSQFQTILQKYPTLHRKANRYYNMVNPVSQKEWIQHRHASTETKQNWIPSLQWMSQYSEKQIPMRKIEKSKMTEQIEIEHTKPKFSFVTNPLEQWKKNKEEFHVISAFKRKSKPLVQTEVLPSMTTQNTTNIVTENYLQTEFVHKKENKSVLHDTEIQQEWEEAVTERILEKVQTLWKEQRKEQFAQLKVPQQSIEPMQAVTNVPEQENGMVSALELERMYDKIYTRIERTLASERRRMGL